MVDLHADDTILITNTREEMEIIVEEIEIEGRFQDIMHFLRCLETKSQLRFLDFLLFHKEKSKNKSEALYCQIKLKSK